MMPTPTKKKPSAAVSRAARAIKKQMDAERGAVRNREASKKRRAAEKANGTAQKKGTGNRFTNPDGSPKKRPATPEDRHFKDTAICGQPRSKRYANDPDDPGVCTQTAGWGTEHVGYGSCRFHNGNAPGQKIAAAREEIAADMVEAELRLLDTYGEDIEIDPHKALAAEVKRTSGHVHWLQQKIKDMDEDDLWQTTQSGRTASAILRTYQEERDRLVSVCKSAITAGVAERAITLAEEQGKILAMVIRDILHDKGLALTPVQLHASSGIVRKHLMALDELGSEVIDVKEVQPEEATLSA